MEKSEKVKVEIAKALARLAAPGKLQEAMPDQDAMEEERD